MNNKKIIAIANRGEVAVRIHRAIKALGYESLLLHSKPDKNTIAYRLCDHTQEVGSAPSSESYLNIKNVVDAAKTGGAIALHPGFGFLSENADFTDACTNNNILFIGPSSKSQRLFGDKISAKDFCEKVKVPTLPSYRGKDKSLKTLKVKAKEIGYPVLVKAAAGGGGRGMRVVLNEDELNEKLEQAKNEALKAFGSDEIFLEKYLETSKHIEIQIFGDATGHVHVLGERECSVQRRHQKIIEEARSASLSDDKRDEVYGYARTLAAESGYSGAGTVEFLFSDNKFYFLEVNTRLQVEHPVTEEVFGVDLVQAQIKTAFNENINWNNPKPKGHSIECRIYAENLKGFPSTGELGSIIFPQGDGIRLEIGFAKGDMITPFYDSMIAKLIVTEADRSSAIDKTLNTLKNSYLTGIETNIPLLISILNHKDFIDSTMTTSFFEENYAEGLTSPLSDKEINAIFASSKTNSTPIAAFNQRWRF